MIPSVTNEMRRDLAKRLRGAIKDSPRKDMIYDATLTAILGIGVNFYEGYTDASDVAHLADLIDRPTCKMLDHETSGHQPNGQECSCCGEVFILTWRDAWNYCPNCGAEVVE